MYTRISKLGIYARVDKPILTIDYFRIDAKF